MEDHSQRILPASFETKFLARRVREEVPPQRAANSDVAVPRQFVSTAIEANQSSFQLYSFGVLNVSSDAKFEHGVLADVDVVGKDLLVESCLSLKSMGI